MPRIDELVNCLGKAKYISILDLARGYWQVPMAEKDWDKTAFATPYGLYQFTVTGSSSHLSKDDGQIHTRTWDIHSSMSRRSHSVQWNISGTFTASTMSDGDPTSRWADGQSQKVPVCYDTKCVYLGHVVGGGRVGLEPSKVEANQSFPIPTTHKKKTCEFIPWNYWLLYKSHSWVCHHSCTTDQYDKQELSK